MLKKLKQCRNLKEIYETIPEGYYERGSFIMILLMLFMLVAETAARYCTRHASFNEMVTYYYYAGYVIIVFAILLLTVKIAGAGWDGIKEYAKNNAYDIAFIFMLLLAFVSVLNSGDAKTAFMGHWFRQSGFRSYLIYASMYICGKNIIKQRTRMNIYLVFGIVATLQNILLITKYSGYYGSMTGAFYNRNHSAYFITMAIFSIAGLILMDKRICVKVAGTVMYLLNIWCLIINNTFGCYLAVVAGLVFLAAMLLLREKRLNRMVILLAVYFVAVSAWTDYKTNIISDNFGITTNDLGKIAKGDEDAGGAGTGRWELWVNAAKYSVKNPLFGCGPDRLSQIRKKTVNENTEDGNLSEPHNEYLQYAAEIGFPAALCYITGLVMIFISGIKRLKKSDNSLIYDGTIVFAYCVSAFFGVVMFYTAVFFFFILGMTGGRHE